MLKPWSKAEKIIFSLGVVILLSIWIAFGVLNSNTKEVNELTTKIETLEQEKNELLQINASTTTQVNTLKSDLKQANKKIKNLQKKLK